MVAQSNFKKNDMLFVHYKSEMWKSAIIDGFLDFERLNPLSSQGTLLDHNMS